MTDPAAAEEARAAALRELAAAGEAREAAEERTRAAVLAARAARVPVRKVAEVGRVSQDSVSRWVEDQARGLLVAGVSPAEVARRTGARTNTVVRWAREVEKEQARDSAIAAQLDELATAGAYVRENDANE